ADVLTAPPTDSVTARSVFPPVQAIEHRADRDHVDGLAVARHRYHAVLDDAVITVMGEPHPPGAIGRLAVIDHVNEPVEAAGALAQMRLDLVEPPACHLALERLDLLGADQAIAEAQT